MFERRPLWGLIVLLNVCVIIWRIQEPVMLSVEFDGSAAESANTNTNAQHAFDDEYASLPLLRQQLQRQQQQQQLQQQSQQQPQPPGWPSWPNGIGARNSLGKEQLYAGKHLLADSAEANEIVAKVTRQADDSLLYHLNSGDNSRASTSTSRKSSRSDKLIKYYAPNLNVNSIQSTPPSPLVTAATLKHAVDIQTTTTGNMRMSYNFPPDDFHQLIDLHDFTYLISQVGCSRDIQALILVHSAPANEEKRRLIRETWGNTDLLPRLHDVMPLRVIFLLGIVGTEAQQLDIERENFENGDMVQGSFVDSYRNMTYKHVMALKWFQYNCAHAQILLKVDDDVYVNTPQLLIYMAESAGLSDVELTSDEGITTAQKANAATFVPKHTADTVNNAVASNSIESSSSSSKNTSRISSSSSSSSSKSNTPNASDLSVDQQTSTIMPTTNTTQLYTPRMLFRQPHNLLFCRTTINAKVKRSYRSKWRVAAREFPDTYYPPYCPGFAIIYSADVVLSLYNAAQLSTYFWIDDVHITGVLAQNVSVPITDANRFILYEDNCDNLLNGVMSSENLEFVYAWHFVKAKHWQQLFDLYLPKARRHLVHKKTTYKPTEFNKFKSYR